MAEPSNVTPGKKAPVKDETGLLEVLSLLIETEKAKTTSDLLKYARQYGAPEAEERLRVLEAENIPVDLAFDSISVHLRLLAYKRNSELLASCRGQKVGLILPLPPHLPNLFLPVADVTLLEPDEVTVHGSLHDLMDRAVKGSRECRAKAQEMQALVFEVFRDEGDLFVDAAVADVLEPKLLPPGIRLMAHLRPHRNPHDVQIHLAQEVSFI
ncbi:MAG TPA: hypothetical protein VF507_02195 [Pyrinomonadaceae bacterium]|jgi:hypothetical protein